MHDKTIAELAQGLKNKEFSSVELTQGFLARIRQHNPELNAFVTVTEEQALAQAQAADAALAAGQAGPLTGVPIAQKDIFCTKGVRTSCGSKMLDNFIAPYDATVVERFKQAGSVMLGKLNMDEFAMGSSNETSFYGPVKNPWDIGTVPGGGGRSPARPRRHRHRHRRLHPPAGVVLRHHGAQAHLRAGVPLGHDRLRFQPGPGRPHGPHRRGLRADAPGHGGFRPQGFHQPGPTGAGLFRRPE
jgi:hypothetical protein